MKCVRTLCLAAAAMVSAAAGLPGAEPQSGDGRQWKVFVFHTSHCDPGWHDLPARIMEKHAHYLDTLVELCDKTKNEPPERRFVFTYEHSWPLDYYERTLPKEKFEKLMEVCRRGQIEIGALYAGVHTELCGHEELQKELVDVTADWPVNQYIHAHVDEGYRGTGDKEKAGTVDGDGVRYLPDQVEPVRTAAGPVRAALEVESRLTRGPAPARLRRRVVLYRGLKCIEFQNLVDKKASASKEQIYFAFPFALPGKVVARVELPYAMMRWDRDILPGCWRGYNSVQHWVDLSNDEYGITLSPLEAPVVSLGGINSNQWDAKWHKAHMPPNGHVFSYVMSNIWNCNYGLWQGGPATFACRMTSYRGPCDTAAAARFGWGHAAPLSARFLGKQTGTLPSVQYSAIIIDAPNVMATALKRADDGRGWIVRLYETGQLPATTALVRFNFLTPVSASLNTLSEEQVDKLELVGNTVKVQIKSNELMTVRVW